MKITGQAPTRISLFGGSSDLPVFYEKYGGVVISMAINLRQKIELNANPYVERGIPKNADPNFYLTFLKEYSDLTHFIKATTNAPIQSGLGSSASAACALVAALSKLNGEELTKEEIAEKAWDICNNKLGLYSGKQDEYAASFGGFNRITFTKERIFVHPYSKELGKWWSDRILLFFTGSVRKNTKIQEKFKKLSTGEHFSISKIKMNADLAHFHILDKNIEAIAKLLQDSWKHKKMSNPLITTPHIDYIYDKALENGVRAGKLLGSGGGGFMAFLVEPEDQKNLIRELEKIEGVKHYPFKIDWEGVKCE